MAEGRDKSGIEREVSLGGGCCKTEPCALMSEIAVLPSGCDASRPTLRPDLGRIGGCWVNGGAGQQPQPWSTVNTDRGRDGQVVAKVSQQL